MSGDQNPFFKLYVRDIEDSVRDRGLSPEEVGALVMFMCMQWRQQGPVPNDHNVFRRYTGWDGRLAKRLLARLVGIGVVKSSDDGLYSQRMTDEITKYCNRVNASVQREENRRKAARGSKLRDSYPVATPELSVSYPVANGQQSKKPNDINKGQGTGQGILKNIEDRKNKTLGQSDLIDRVECGSKPDRAKPRPKPTDAQFTAFWDAYPRRVKKAEARKKFLNLKPGDASLAIEGARSYAREVAADGRDPSKTLHPTTYLNQRVFEDLKDASTDAAAPEPVNGKAWGFWRSEREQWAKYSPDAWRAALDKAKPNGTWPWWQLGPPPGHRECLVHPTVVDERGLADVYRGKISHHD